MSSLPDGSSVTGVDSILLPILSFGTPNLVDCETSAGCHHVARGGNLALERIVDVNVDPPVFDVPNQ